MESKNQMGGEGGSLNGLSEIFGHPRAKLSFNPISESMPKMTRQLRTTINKEAHRRAQVEEARIRDALTSEAERLLASGETVESILAVLCARGSRAGGKGKSTSRNDGAKSEYRQAIAKPEREVCWIDIGDKADIVDLDAL